MDIISSEGFWSKFKCRSLQLATLAIKNPKWIAMFLFSRIHAIRDLVQLLSKRPSTVNHKNEPSVLRDLETEKVVRTLKKDGLYVGIAVPESLLQEILYFCK